jgi:hypothetical protein
MMERSYSEMLARDTFLSRAQYLLLGGTVANETFGAERYLNQKFYASRAWKSSRDIVIIRDEGCDLGVMGHEIHDKILVHHINPINARMLKEADPLLFDPENLISVSNNTHQAIHYGDASMLPQPMLERKPGDHLLWERMW